MRTFYKDKVVLITGASMGIGKEIARQVLLFRGKVVMTGRDLQKLEAARNELNDGRNNILIHCGNVADHEDNILLVDKIIKTFGRLDVLITNAGLSCFGEVGQMNTGVVKQVIDTNIYGSLFPAMAALPELKRSEGVLLFVSSIAGFHGLPGYSAYSLSKMALRALSQSMHVELKNSGVAVCISFVGFTENDPGKRTLSPGGDLVQVGARHKLFTSKRNETALKLLKQIAKREYTSTHSLVGIFTELISRYFPALISVVFQRNYRKFTAG